MNEKARAEDEDVRAYFTGPIMEWRRDPDPTSPGEWITLKFDTGGEVKIFTRNPLVWIQPEAQ